MSGISASELLALSARCLLYKPSLEDILWLNFAVTYRCNSHCTMCSIWKKYQKQPELVKQELPLDAIAKFAATSYFDKLASISFTGGEPFLRDDFVDLVGLFVREHPRAVYGISTNGLDSDLTVSGVREIESRYNPRHLGISVSLDGILEKHDQLRRVPGAFAAVSDTVQRLKSETSANVGLNFTITPWNYRELLAVYMYAKEHNATFVTCFAHHSDTFYNNAEIQFHWEESDYAAVETALNDIIREKIRNESPWNKITDPYAYFLSCCTGFERSRVRPHACYSGTHSLFLDPYGNVYPCLLLDRKFGNINERDFERLWVSSEADALRADIRAGICSCWVGCEAIPSTLRDFGLVKWNIRNKF